MSKQNFEKKNETVRSLNFCLKYFFQFFFSFSLVNFLFTQLWNCFFLYDDDYNFLPLETVEEEEEEKEESNDTEDGGG